MRATTLTDALLNPILARDPAGPRVTHYNDAEGSRIELSTLTLANWAAKTANLIRDEFGLTDGARVSVLLPAHWQTAAVLLGVWWAGAEVLLEPDSTAELALCTMDRLKEAEAGEVAVLSLDAFGAPVRDLPIGVTDYATSVRVHGDQFRPAGAGPALHGLSVADVLARAHTSAEAQGFTETSRVLSSRDWDAPEALIDGFIAVLAAGGSLVQVTAPDGATRGRRIDTERVTVEI